MQDQVLLLVEFDHELMEKRKAARGTADGLDSEAITLLVDNIHSIPVRWDSKDSFRKLTITNITDIPSCAATAGETLLPFLVSRCIGSQGFPTCDRVCRHTGAFYIA